MVGFAAEVPSAVTFPAWMLGTATVASENITCTLPVSRSVSAAGVPLYGTCWIASPYCVFRFSMNRWCGLPLPTDA